MPAKGQAFDKPGINYLHKAGSAKAAQIKAALAKSQRATELSTEITKRVEAAKIEDKRKQHALKVIDEALERLSNGIDPLSELKPPPNCKVCAGNVHGVHHFLCRKRINEPSGPERPLRTFIFYKLGSAWREHLYKESTSNSAVSACPLPALTLLNARSIVHAASPLNRDIHMYII